MFRLGPILGATIFLRLGSFTILWIARASIPQETLGVICRAGWLLLGAALIMQSPCSKLVHNPVGPTTRSGSAEPAVFWTSPGKTTIIPSKRPLSDPSHDCCQCYLLTVSGCLRRNGGDVSCRSVFSDSFPVTLTNSATEGVSIFFRQ